jgi:hypothetical protein
MNRNCEASRRIPNAEGGLQPVRCKTCIEKKSRCTYAATNIEHSRIIEALEPIARRSTSSESFPLFFPLQIVSNHPF